MEYSPKKISANRTTRVLTIEWEDGHLSRYPFGLLRAACPCASCRGGHENMRSEPDEEVFEIDLPESAATRMKKLEAVGSYAITIEWEDGHHFGIFNWQYLRKLCPCAICRPSN
ncbi:MAG: DUF971 domain-containing protein [Chloroflexota bacterium]|jgi:DUF971 family protein|uniref:DUF971 domain-containing protein n=1 Tax=Bellilinea sp. TaxID=2838785 RepID=UPI002ADDA2A6|nr:DUF971 domain-containing protein [Bellilinea sp.]